MLAKLLLRPPLPHPIFVRQLRVAARRRGTKDLGGSIGIAFVGGAALVLLVARRLPGAFFEGGANFALLLLFLESFTLISPLMAAVGLVNEHEENTLTSLTVSRMSPGRIVLGYWLYAMWSAIENVLLLVPCFALLYWWGGITIGEYIQSQFLLLCYTAFVAMGSISIGYSTVQTMERAKRSQARDALSGRLSLLSNLFKSTGSQGTAQAVVGLVYVAFVMLPLIVGPVAALVLTVDMQNLGNFSPGASAATGLSLDAGPFRALALFAPSAAPLFDVHMPMFGYDLPAWLAFPPIFALGAVCFFLHGRYLLTMRQYNTSRDMRISLALFAFGGLAAVAGVFWTRDGYLPLALSCYWMAAFLLVALDSCVRDDNLPEVGKYPTPIVGDPAFPHRGILQNFFGSGPAFSVLVLAPMGIAVLAAAHLSGGALIEREIARLMALVAICATSSIVFGRSLLRLGLRDRNVTPILILTWVMLWLLSSHLWRLASPFRLNLISAETAAWIGIAAGGLVPTAPVADGVMRLIAMLRGDQFAVALQSSDPGYFQHEAMRSFDSAVPGAADLMLVSACVWLLAALCLSVASGYVLRRRLARRDMALEQLGKERA